MTPNPPPRLATWILKRFGCSPNTDVIIGDLNEEYRQWPSRGWYWYQALIAVITGFRSEISAHRWGAVGASFLGWFVFLMWSLLMSRLFTEILSTRQVGLWMLQTNGMPLVAAVPLIALLAWFAAWGCGWLISSLSRPHHRAPVLLFGMSLMAVGLSAVFLTLQNGGIVIAVADVFSPNVTVRISWQVWIFALCNPFSIVSLLIGGGFFEKRNQDDVRKLA